MIHEVRPHTHPTDRDTSESEARCDELYQKLRPSEIDTILQHISEAEGQNVTLLKRKARENILGSPKIDPDIEPEMISQDNQCPTWKFVTNCGTYVISVEKPN